MTHHDYQSASELGNQREIPPILLEALLSSFGSLLILKGKLSDAPGVSHREGQVTPQLCSFPLPPELIRSVFPNDFSDTITRSNATATYISPNIPDSEAPNVEVESILVTYSYRLPAHDMDMDAWIFLETRNDDTSGSAGLDFVQDGRIVYPGDPAAADLPLTTDELESLVSDRSLTDEDLNALRNIMSYIEDQPTHT